MKRHGDDEIGVIQQRASRAVEPAREARHQVEPVGMFERQDRAAAGVVVAHHRAGAVEGGRIGVAGAAAGSRAGIEIEGQAATGAARPVQEGDRLPARGAQAARLGDLRAAADAERRKDEIEHATPRASEPALQRPFHVATIAGMTAPRIFDAHALALRRARAGRLGGDRFLAREAEESIAARLAATNRRFERVLRLDALGEDETVPGDDGAFDLVTSVLALQAVNDLPGALLQIRRKLKPDGLFLGALFGGETLHELRAAFAQAELETLGGISPRVAPFADVRDLGGLLQRAGFALPVADVERTTVRYGSFAKLVRDLRAQGATNALSDRSRRPLARRTLAALIACYEPVVATFDIVYLTGWSPHESQQKPLAPGSATVRLADALGTEEHKTG